MKSNQNLMTEKQKMRSGQYYNAFDKALLRESSLVPRDRKRASKLCKQLNDFVLS
jgi:hypothetical protein